MRSRSFPMAWIIALMLSLAALAGCQETEDKSTAEQSEPAASKDTGRSAAPSSSQPATTQEPACADCGVVSAIETMKTDGKASGAGAAGGAVAGVVIGNQIGSGSGKDIARIVGGIGGAIAGHQAEKKIRSETFYRVTVAMETGGTRVVDVPSADGISVGTKVRVENGNLFLRGN